MIATALVSSVVVPQGAGVRRAVCGPVRRPMCVTTRWGEFGGEHDGIEKKKSATFLVERLEESQIGRRFFFSIPSFSPPKSPECVVTL
eukprot:1328515-Prymnesium_polylepis.1